MRRSRVISFSLAGYVSEAFRMSGIGMWVLTVEISLRVVLDSLSAPRHIERPDLFDLDT